MPFIQSPLVYGLHACPEEIGQKLLKRELPHLEKSKNLWDWLGSGIYFWEGNYKRAKEYGEEQSKRGKYPKAVVIGAVIDLGHCLNLLDGDSIELLTEAYKQLKLQSEGKGEVLPKNTLIKEGLTFDRKLDCAVVETLCQIMENLGKPPFDSIRAAFLEGKPAYEGSNFRVQDHIQICIRNPEKCIKGYFIP